MLASAILSYLGPFPSEYRERLKDMFKEFLVQKDIDHSNNFKFVYFMVPQLEILRWNFQNLPDDQVSIENGVIVRKAHNWPLMIDPQSQGCNWIQSLE
jgi:hypothetical protein